MPMLIGMVVFTICLKYIFQTFKWSEIAYILRSAKLLWLLVAGSLSILLFWFFRSLRWLVLLKAVGVHVCFLNLYFCTAMSLTVSTLTPLQSGEILKIELLRRQNLMDRSTGYSSLLLERVLDVFVISIIAVVGAIYHMYFNLDQASFWVVLAGFITLIILVISLLLKIKARFVTTEWMKQMPLYAYDGRTVFIVMVITFCSWAMVAIGWQVCLFSISLHLALGEIIFMVASLSIINVLSFVPGAVGVFEVGVTAFLLHFGQNAALAQTGAIILRFQLLLIVVLGAIHYVLWKYWKTGGDLQCNRPQGRPD